MTARTEEQTVPLDEREIRLLRSKRLGLLFALMLIVDAAVVIGVVYASMTTPDFLDFWTVVCLVPVAFVLLVITLGAEADWHSVRKDLQAGTKSCRNGRIGSLHKHDDGESAATYSIGVVVDGPESPLVFPVPLEVHEAVKEGQAAWIAYAPLSYTLFELKTGTCAYLAIGMEHSKTKTRLTAPGAPPGH